MRAHVEGLILLLAACAPAWAQDDVPRAPRIDTTPQTTVTAPSASALRPPTATRLAALPEERREVPDEIIVTGQGWRLPDLGSRWRAQQQAAERERRLHAVFLPLYDPDKPPQHSDGFWQNSEAQRHGVIELFRLRFGRPREE